MQQQERDLISGLFDRLKPFESQPRDNEVEQFIWDRASKQPASAYLLVQTVLVQEQALKAAQERIAELEAKAAAAAPQPEAGFLGSAPKIGPWGAPRTSVPQTQATPAPGTSMAPSTRSPLQAAVSPQQQPAAGGSFLRTAMMTAAGVAGGALLFEGIRGLMGSNPGPFGQQQAAFGGTTDSTPPELLPPDSSMQQQQAFADDQAGAEDYDTASLDDGSGGGDDDSWA
jgi:hypothetical protein